MAEETENTTETTETTEAAPEEPKRPALPEGTRLYATGKRKRAIARVWVTAGTGEFTINRKKASDYFVRETSLMVMRESVEVLNASDHYDVWATVKGGGNSAQAEAVRHAVARCLAESDPDMRADLKKAGFLTRDARTKERKKYGQPGARKRFQYSKR